MYEKVEDCPEMPFNGPIREKLRHQRAAIHKLEDQFEDILNTPAPIYDPSKYIIPDDTLWITLPEYDPKTGVKIDYERTFCVSAGHQTLYTQAYVRHLATKLGQAINIIRKYEFVFHLCHEVNKIFRRAICTVKRKGEQWFLLNEITAILRYKRMFERTEKLDDVKITKVFLKDLLNDPELLVSQKAIDSLRQEAQAFNESFDTEETPVEREADNEERKSAS